jgi:hypothetical protein
MADKDSKTVWGASIQTSQDLSDGREAGPCSLAFAAANLINIGNLIATDAGLYRGLPKTASGNPANGGSFEGSGADGF